MEDPAQPINREKRRKDFKRYKKIIGVTSWKEYNSLPAIQKRIQQPTIGGDDK